MKLKIEYVDINLLKGYENNAKIHTPEQIEQIKNSILQFGMDDPIAVWKDNVIIEGHGRLTACKELGIDEVPVIRLDHLTDEQRKVYGVVHNKLTMNTPFDLDVLGAELEGLTDDFDLTDLGFNEAEILELTIDDSPEEIPHADIFKNETGVPASPQIPAFDYSQTGSDIAPQVTREDLNAYAQNAEQLVTRRVIIVYRTEEEAARLKVILGVSPEEQLGVVYKAEDLVIE